MAMKGCVQWNPIYDWKDLRLRQGSNPGPLDQYALSYRGSYIDTKFQLTTKGKNIFLFPLIVLNNQIYSDMYFQLTTNGNPSH